jgi:hypothetical protein
MLTLKLNFQLITPRYQIFNPIFMNYKNVPWSMSLNTGPSGIRMVTLRTLFKFGFL